MPQFLVQVAYNTPGWQALVNQPQDRFEAVRPAIEKLGGRIVSGYFSFGDYDALVIVDMPNAVSAAALSIAFAAGGSIRASKTIPLLTREEAIEALKQAATCGYRPAVRAAA